MSAEGTLRIKASKDLGEVIASVANSTGDELAAMRMRTPEEVRAVITGLVNAMTIAWPEAQLLVWGAAATYGGTVHE